ncbi:uncharacterized protein TNCV_4329971 [Trichonephila clavipes]|nr:uncharacterized protein TNCV_4329971 [Trichonephila clavipes]
MDILHKIIAACDKLQNALHMEMNGRLPQNKPNKKKLSKKRKNKAKESTEEFIFPKKTARPISPTPTQDPIETNNHFSDLEQDVEHPLSIDKQVITEVVTPKKTLPHPIMLKINDNFREQIKRISEKFPSLRLKDPSEKKSKLQLQDLALKHFENTVLRDDEGRLFDYEQVLVDWEKEGIIEKIAQDEPKNGGKFHYLPHRPVFKENSTTKIRPVFDGSAHHGKSCSLNDCVEKGPNLIEMIPEILNCFRLGKIGVISDIRKAFFKISLHENDMDFLRFLCPFLLAAILNHHFKQAPEHLEAAEKLKDSMYVDYCLASVDSSKELESFQRDSTELLALGKFDLRGWRHSDIESNFDFQDNQQKSDQQEIQVLGLMWNVKEDTFPISYRETESKEVTKRRILSLAHRIFDPIGFTCPITLIPKLLIQECWKIEASWDSKLQIDIERKLEKWKTNL